MSADKNGQRNMSRHILPTSGNLLGLCFAILSFIRVSNLGNQTIIDEVIVIAIVLFLVASLVSYASMRARRRGEHFERVAEIIFLAGLSLLALIAVGVGVEMLH